MNFGIIGTNFVSDRFAESAKNIKDCNLVAVCSGRIENAEAFAKRHSVSEVYNSYSDMLKASDIDAVYIATPNSTHEEIAADCIKAGKHIFCEKPMASNFDEVSRLVALARDAGVYLHEGLFPLFSDNYKRIKENLKNIGRVRQVNINMSQYSSRYDAYLAGKNPTTFRPELSNGALMDLGVYTLAICIDLFGVPKSVHASSVLLENGVDIVSSVMLTYGGFVANLAVSKVSDSENRFEICGEAGVISVNHPTRIKSVILKDRISKTEVELANGTEPDFSFEISEMLNAVAANETEAKSVPLDLSLDLHKLLTECRRLCGVKYPADKA